MTLTKYLQRALSSQLADAWGRSDGKAAFTTFMSHKENIDPELWPELIKRVWRAWGEKDRAKALECVTSAETLGLGFQSAYASLAAFEAAEEPKKALELLPSVINEHSMSGKALRTLVARAASVDAKATLQMVADLNEPVRTENIEYVARMALYNGDAETAFSAASQMPPSTMSLNMLEKSSTALAESSDDPYAILNQVSDPLQRTMVASGILHGLFKQQGPMAVDQAVSQGDGFWLEAACTALLPPEKDPNSGDDVVEKFDWKSLSESSKAALIEYATRNWSAKRVALMREQLQ